jgi:hypothetical protein
VEEKVLNNKMKLDYIAKLMNLFSVRVSAWGERNNQKFRKETSRKCWELEVFFSV